MFSACCCSWLWVLNLRQLGDAVDELGDLGPEALLDVGQAVLGVLGDVVEERRLDRDRVEPEVGEDLGRRDRVRDVRLAGRPALARRARRRRGRRRARPARGRRPGGARGSAAWRSRPQGVEVGSGRLPCRRSPGATDAASRRGPRPRSGAASRLRSSVRGRRAGHSVARIRGSARESAVALRRRAASASARSSHGIGPSGPMIDCSWPLPASRTMSPGRARSKAASIAARRSAMTSRSWSAAPAGGLGAARDLVEDRVAVLAARVLVGHDDERGALARDPAHHRALLVSRSPADPKTAITPPPPGRGQRGEQVEDRLEGGRAVGVVDDDPERLAAVEALHPARDAGDARRGPSRTAAGSRPSASPSATTASALWTLNRPTSRSSSVAAPLARRRRSGGRARPPRRGSRGRRPPDPCRSVRTRAPASWATPMNAPAVGSSALTIAAFGQPTPPALGGFAGPTREPLEERQLGVAVRLPRPVELEVLVGQVGQDRDVVGDAADAVERRGRARSSRRPRPRRRPRTIARRARWRAGRARASSRARGSPRWTPPIRVATVPISPVRIAGRLERRRGEERGRRLAVRAGDPDDRQLAARIAVPPGRGRRERAAACRSTTSWGSASLGERRARRSRPRRRPRAAAATNSWPSTWSPGTATNSAPGRTVARVVGDAADRDVGQAGRADRPAVAPGAAEPAARRRAGRSARRARPVASGSAAARQLGDRGVGVASSAGPPRATRPVSAPEPVAARVEDPLVGAGELEPAAAERALVLVQAPHRLALGRLARGRPATSTPPRSISVAALADRELDRPPAEEVERARVVAPARRRGRPSGRWRAARRGGTGRGPASGVAGRGVGAGLEVDEVAGAERGAPPGDERGSRGPNVKWRRSPVSSSRS